MSACVICWVQCDLVRHAMFLTVLRKGALDRFGPNLEKETEGFC